jgi:hypothetical protein
MEPVHPRFVPDAGLDRAAMEALQRDLAETAVVGDDRYLHDADTALGEPAGEPRRVRVLDVAGEQFVADGEQGGAHQAGR